MKNIFYLIFLATLLINGNNYKTLNILKGELLYIADVDTDGDGIEDKVDLDDDNDGIPDDIECGGVTSIELRNLTWAAIKGFLGNLRVGDVAISSKVFADGDGNEYDLRLEVIERFSSDNIFSGQFGIDTNNISVSGFPNQDDHVKVDLSFVKSESVTPSTLEGIPVTFTEVQISFFDIDNYGANYTDVAGYVSAPTSIDFIGSKLSPYNYGGSNYVYALTNYKIFNSGFDLTDKDYSVKATYADFTSAVVLFGLHGTYASPIERGIIIQVKIKHCTSDSDSDGILDALDIDSDNDGIYDIVEAGNGHLDTDNDGRIDGVSFGSNGLGDDVETTPDSGSINYTPFDSDNDNKLDTQELDSDNDGCNDVVEAGYNDADNNGILGNEPISIDANGNVTSAIDGYTLPLDGDTNMIFDFQESGGVLSIILQPLSQRHCETNEVVFSTEISLPNTTAITYQWEVNEGSGWNTVSDGAIYSGSSSEELHIMDAPLTFDDFNYRVVVTNLSYRCFQKIISNTATLELDPLPNTILTITNPIQCFGQSSSITINNSQLGVKYQLRLDTDDTIVDNSILGNGNDISFVVSPSSTTMYNVLATDVVSNCNVEMDNKSTVTVNALPIDNLNFINDAVCIGNPVDLVLENSEKDISYQLIDESNTPIGSPMLGTGSNIVFTVNPIVTTTYNLLSTNTITNCSILQAQTGTVTVFPLPDIIPLVTLTQCDDDIDGLAPFNLTEANPLISSNHLNETFIYYLNYAEADNGGATGLITEYTNYINPIVFKGSSVYARIESEFGCHRVAEIELLVGASNIPLDFHLNYYECSIGGVDSNDSAIFDFSDAKQTIEDLFTGNVTATFYRNEADALAEQNFISDISNYKGTLNIQNIYVRVDSDIVNACMGLGHHITLLTKPLPETKTITPYTLCGDNNETSFELAVKDIEVIGSQINPILVSYHESLEDAKNYSSFGIDKNNYTNITSPQTIYVRAAFDENDNGLLDSEECINTNMSFELEVIPSPILPNQIIINKCSEQLDTLYDLTLRETDILQVDPEIVTFDYYETQQDVNLDNRISNYAQYLNTTLNHTVIVVATGSNGCKSQTSLELSTTLYPSLNLIPSPIEECETDNNGFDHFDLTRSELEIINGLDRDNFIIDYYVNLIDAEEGKDNYIQDATNFENTIKQSQDIFVRVKEKNTDCPRIIPLTLIVNSVPPIPLLPKYVLCLDVSSNVLTPSLETFIPSPPIETQLSSANYKFQWYRGAKMDISVDNAIMGETSSSFTPTTSGFYTVEVTDLNTECSIDATTEVVESYPPEGINVELKTNAFATNDIIEVEVRGIGTYEYRLDYGIWQTENVFENVTRGEHVVYVRDIYNCGVLVSETKTIVDFPKFFTPNNDGYNDFWHIYGIQKLQNTKVYIFNRYGKLLKELLPNGMGWDGTSKGIALPSDDYWFTVEYTEPKDNIRRLFKSHFTLKR